MYKILLALLAMAGIPVAACAQSTPEMNGQSKNDKILVTFFSATGTTARVAEKLAEATGGTLYAITPTRPYTTADLDWHDRRSRSSVEMDDPQSRPEIGGKEVNTAGYDIIFIGYPIWWDLAPRIIETFIEQHDLRGKRVIPFATSGGSRLANSAAALKRAYPELHWLEGRLLNRADDREIRDWFEKLGVGRSE